MGIELALYAGRPGRKKGAGEALLRMSHEHGDALASALGALDRHNSGVLGRVDPYRDTWINEQEAEVARREAAVLIERCTTERQRAALVDLASMLDACVATPGSCLLFIGD